MKLIVTDLDGTLLRNNKTISEYTKNIFKMCQDRGYKIVFATARAEKSMTRFIEAIKPDAVISNGGSMITVADRIIHRSIISSSDVKTITNMAIALTDGKCRITAESIEGYFCNFTPDDPDRFNAFNYRDFHDFEIPSYKITCELAESIWGDEIVSCCKDCSVIKYTGKKWQRFACKSATKETAIAILTKYFDINLEDVIAFGDDCNDIGMLKLSGMSVAVLNSIDEVKKIADHVTDSNENDGVASFLENCY